MLLEISVLTFTLAFVLFSFFSILYLLQLRRTAKSIEDVLHTLNKSLPSILSKADDIVSNLADASQILKDHASRLSRSMDKMEGLVDDIVRFEQALRKEIEIPVMQAIGTCNAFMRGFRAFLLTLFSRS
jgi:uncharacterized protein YoxC